MSPFARIMRAEGFFNDRVIRLKTLNQTEAFIRLVASGLLYSGVIRRYFNYRYIITGGHYEQRTCKNLRS